MQYLKLENSLSRIQNHISLTICSSAKKHFAHFITVECLIVRIPGSNYLIKFSCKFYLLDMQLRMICVGIEICT